MAMKVLANDGMAPDGVKVLQEAGFTVITKNVPQEKLQEVINSEGYQTLLVRSATKVRKDLIDACPGLKFVGRGGVGMDNIDVDYARNKGIEVANTPAASTQSVAELVMGHMFTMCRFLYDANREMPIKGNSDFESLKKKYAKGSELRGKILGVIGFGRIGQSVAQYALGCGMKVMYYDPFVDVKSLEIQLFGVTKIDVPVQRPELNDLLGQSDFLSLHIPYVDGPLITLKEIALMKDGVMIVNAARGGVIDETALLTALDSGKIAGAALDVFENEPTPNPELLKHPRVSLSPHIGAATSEAQARIGTELADKIIAYFKK